MYYYVFNPTAGGGRSNLQDKLRTRLRALGIDGEFAKTTSGGDATKLAKLAIEKGYTTIVAVGGDGTVNEVINGITGDQAAVGIIPLGNSNLIAAQLGINGWEQACEVLAARRLTSYGLIAAGQNFFLSTLTLGFETELDKTLDNDVSGLRGRAKQFRQSWGHASQFAALRCRIKVDDRYEMECDLFTLSVTNQKFLSPLAENKLVISLSDRPGARQRAAYLWQLLRGGSPLEEAATTRFPADRVIIETDPPTGLTVDGKLAGRTPIAIRLTDRRIRFITEKAASRLA